MLLLRRPAVRTATVTCLPGTQHVSALSSYCQTFWSSFVPWATQMYLMRRILSQQRKIPSITQKAKRKQFSKCFPFLERCWCKNKMWKSKAEEPNTIHLACLKQDLFYVPATVIRFRKYFHRSELICDCECHNSCTTPRLRSELQNYENYREIIKIWIKEKENENTKAFFFVGRQYKFKVLQLTLDRDTNAKFLIEMQLGKSHCQLSEANPT